METKIQKIFGRRYIFKQVNHFSYKKNFERFFIVTDRSKNNHYCNISSNKKIEIMNNNLNY